MGLPRDDFLNFAAPEPTTNQLRIVATLQALDDKIELNRRMNETLDEMAWALFKSWFVDFDPVRAKMEGRWRPGESLPGLPAHFYDLFPTRLVDSELGEIPEGWEVRPLDAIAKFKNGLALQRFRPDEGEERLPVLKIAQLRAGSTDDGEWARATIAPECVVKDGDVIFSWSGSLIVRVWTGGRAALNQHLFKVTSTEFPRWFYLHWVLEHLSEFQYIASGKATTMGHIQRHHLTEALCVVPPAELIDGANAVLSPLVDRQVGADLESRTLAGMRDALLPKLISGDLRTSAAANVGSEA